MIYKINARGGYLSGPASDSTKKAYENLDKEQVDDSGHHFLVSLRPNLNSLYAV